MAYFLFKSTIHSNHLATRQSKDDASDLYHLRSNMRI